MDSKNHGPLVADFKVIPIDGAWFWEWQIPGTEDTYAGFSETRQAAMDAAFDIIVRHYERLN